MELDVQARDFPLTEGLHAAIAAALRPYAAAFDEVVRKVAVRVYDLNGPRGGPDKGCLVVADLNDGRVIVSSDVDEDLYRAIPKHFCVVDGIDGMEGNGPIQGERKHAGVIVAGDDMVAVDATCCRIMGIDPSKIEYLRRASAGHLEEGTFRQLGDTISAVATPFKLLQQFSTYRLGGA